MRVVVVALFGAVFVGSFTGCEPGDAGPVFDGPTYHADVAPLLMNHCASCHQDGGIAPFPLLTYDDAVAQKDAIAFSVANRLMPPWNIDNSGDCQTFQDARWLSDDEIDVVTAWVEAGAVEGEKPGQALTPPTPDQLEDDDAVYVEMAVPYLPTAQAEYPNDDYRCFFLEPGNVDDAYVTGFEIFPGQPQEVHHMLLFSLLDASAEAAAQGLDDADDAPGWTCFGAAGEGVDQDQTLLVASWAPGTNVMRYPAGTGVFVPGGRRMVMQIHYNLLAGAVEDLTGIKIAMAPSVEKDALLLPLADDGFELAPNEPRVEFSFTQSLLGLPESLEVHGVFPHMHTMGETLRLTKNAIGDVDRSDEECLADVPRWDFHWQQLAFYDQPIIVDGGHQLDVTCAWDTSGRTTPTTWGEGTQDEMCLVFAYVTREAGGSIIELFNSL